METILSQDLLLPLSEIYIDFLNYRAKKEFMEGTTAAGKTTIGAIKFMLRVAESKQKYHMIASADIRNRRKKRNQSRARHFRCIWFPCRVQRFRRCEYQASTYKIHYTKGHKNYLRLWIWR